MAGLNDRKRLAALLEGWARWCDRGGLGQLGPSGSVLGRWIENKGHMNFGGGGGPKVPMTTDEERVEQVVQLIYRDNPLRADVLRLEYAAGWRGVAERRQIQDYDPRGTGQRENALALGIGFSTYKRHLSQAQQTIVEQLGK